jgi:hypothetical protein
MPATTRTIKMVSIDIKDYLNYIYVFTDEIINEDPCHPLFF